MENLKCFTEAIETKFLDREPFRLNHKLADHPALELENIAKIILELPSEKVMFSKGLNDLKVNFDDALTEDTKTLDLNEIIETIRNSNSYIAARNLELHPSFKDLYDDLMNDIGIFMKANGTGTKPHEPMLWLFIASPGAVTPFHFDRFTNFIMQIRGSKELAVFPPRKEEVIKTSDVEAYIDWRGQTPEWKDAMSMLISLTSKKVKPFIYHILQVTMLKMEWMIFQSLFPFFIIQMKH